MTEAEQPEIRELSIKDLATRINKSYITALNYVHRGMIKGVRKGNEWVVPVEEVERFEREGNHPDYNKPGGSDNGW